MRVIGVCPAELKRLPATGVPMRFRYETSLLFGLRSLKDKPQRIDSGMIQDPAVTPAPANGEAPATGQRRGWARAAMVLLLLGFAVVVLSDPTADPPLGTSGLEGELLLGARAVVPGETVMLGEWNPWFLAPSQLAVTGAAFRLEGVSLALARRVNAVFVLVLVAVFHEVVRRSLGPRRALLASVFLMVNPALFAAARYASLASFSLLWMLLGVSLASGPGGGELQVRRGRMFAAGAVTTWAALLENAPVNVFFLVAAVIWSALVRLHAWKMPWVSAAKSRLRWFWAGAGTLGAVYAGAMATRGDAAWATWGHFLHPTPRLVAANFIRAPVHLAELFRLMPVVTVLTLVFFLFYGKSVFGPVARHRRLDEVRVWFFAWLVSGFAYFTLAGSHQLETLVLLVVPMCVLAVEGLSHLFRLRTLARPRLDVMIVAMLIAGFSWFAGCWLVDRFYPFWAGEFWNAHRIRGSYLLLALFWPAATGILIWLYLKWKHLEVRVPPLLVLAATFGIAACSLVPAALRMGEWWSGRTHAVDAARAEFQDLPAGSMVVGSWAPTLTLGTRSGAAVIWPGVNDGNQPWHDRVTHLLFDAGEGRDSLRRVIVRPETSRTRLTFGARTMTLIGLAPPQAGSDPGNR